MTKRGVEREQILIRLDRGDDVGMELTPLTSAAVDLAALLAGSFDQDATHGRRRCREEMTSAVPAGRRFFAVADQPEVDPCTKAGLESMARLLAGQFPGGQLAEFVVDQRQEPAASCRRRLVRSSKGW